MGATDAHGRSCLYFGLYVHRIFRIFRSGTVAVAATLRLGIRRLLVSQHSIARRGDRPDGPDAVPLRLFAGAGGFFRAVRLHPRSQSYPRLQSLAQFYDHCTAFSASGDRGGVGVGADGNPQRLRYGPVFWGGYLHHGDLSHLVCYGRAGGRHSIGRLFAPVRPRFNLVGTPFPSPRQFLPNLHFL